MKGTYILVIYIPVTSKIKIGALGKILFNEGYYLYIGSAMGSKGSANLKNRINRHLSFSISKKLHWHIDYLLNSEKSYLTSLYLIPSINRLECIIAKEIADLANGFVGNFGSSDCYCQSHLFYFKSKESFNLELLNEKVYQNR
jgi:Uri superfamily endonuclease